MRGNLGWTKEKIEQARDRAGMAAMVDIDTFLSALDEIEHLTAELDDLRDDDDIEDPPVWTEEQSQAFFALMESFPVDPEVTLWNEFHERIGEMSMEEVKDAKRKLDTYDAQTAQLAAALAREQAYRDALESLRQTNHYDCEDGWYSCPKVPDYYGTDGPDCTCGVDRHNEIIDAALRDNKP